MQVSVNENGIYKNVAFRYNENVYDHVNLCSNNCSIRVRTEY